MNIILPKPINLITQFITKIWAKTGPNIDQLKSTRKQVPNQLIELSYKQEPASCVCLIMYACIRIKYAQALDNLWGLAQVLEMSDF